MNIVPKIIFSSINIYYREMSINSKKDKFKERDSKLPYAFPSSVMLEIEQTKTRLNASRNQLITGI